MKLFSFGNSNSGDDARRRIDEERLAVGDLPIGAQRRLVEMRDRPNFFTSNLSVNEFLLTRHGRCRPLGQVMGSSIYHVGWQWTPAFGYYESQELETVNLAYYTARMLALTRLQQEAALLGA